MSSYVVEIFQPKLINSIDFPTKHLDFVLFIKFLLMH